MCPENEKCCTLFKKKKKSFGGVFKSSMSNGGHFRGKESIQKLQWTV